jgi:hypothetical protein
MNSYYHAKNSANRYGGKPEDYQPIHDFIDSTKAAVGDVRHRAVLHNAFGCFVAERVFGTTITNSDGRKVPVRLIAEEHIIEDLGSLPTLAQCLEGLPITDLLAARMRVTKVIKFEKETDR